MKINKLLVSLLAALSLTVTACNNTDNGGNQEPQHEEEKEQELADEGRMSVGSITSEKKSTLLKFYE